MALARSRKIDAVVTLKLDRLFRSLRHLLNTLEELKSLGILSVATRDFVDWSTPSGRFFLQVLGGFAEMERSLIRERTILGLEHARRVGKTLGRHRTSDYSLIIDLRTRGKSYTEIQAALGVSRGAIYRAISKTSLNKGKKTQ